MSILATEFQFPKKKVSEMTEAEREALAIAIARHHQTAGHTCRPVELEPSKVLDPQSPEARELYERKKRKVVTVYDEGAAGRNGFRFDPVLGYVIDEEDPRVVAQKVDDPVAARRLLTPGPKVPDPFEMYRYDLEQMDSPDRDAEERFSDI